MKNLLTVSFLALVMATGLLPAQQQEERDRLRRDQAEVIRRSDRLMKLMQDLLQRYEEQGRTQEVELLKQGIAHLQESGVLLEIAEVDSHLANEAFNDAARTQTDVIEDLGRLLEILMDRRSVESLDEKIADAARMAAEIRNLEQRQAELQEETRDTVGAEATEAEQRLQQTLQELARGERDEARSNQMDAGLRRPYLESALQSIERLLRRQDRLEENVRRELAGERNPIDDQIFRLGEQQERVRELMQQRSTEQDLQSLARNAQRLAQAAENQDRDEVQQSRDVLQAQLDQAAERQQQRSRDAAGNRDPQAEQLARMMEELAERLRAANQGGEAGLQQMQELGEAAQAAAEQAGAQQADRNTEATEELQQSLGEQADQLNRDAGDERRPGRPLEQAAGSLGESEEQARDGDLNRSLSTLGEALRQLSEAQRRMREANPDAERSASSMAAEADRTARELESAPRAQDAEQAATEALDEAEQALRQTADALRDEEAPQREGQIQQGVQTSRERLEQARATLQAALEQENQPNADRMQAAAERQAALSQQAEQLQQSLQQAQQSGGITPEQQQAASRAVAEAQQQMQQAQQSLQQGRQDGAAQQQEQAAGNLDRAQRELEQNRPLSEDQQARLRQLAEQQERLAEDIIRLAKEAEERQNQRAREALDQAAQAAQRASQAMQQADPEESDQEQQETRDRLEEAAEEMEEERDRYMDLRQEELLFRIKEELEQLLEKQRPITQATREAGAALADGARMTRVLRRNLQRQGTLESELAAKTEFIHIALEEEGNQVFSFVLRSNREDLETITGRLSGREPDAGELTVMLQEDVERRTEQLLEALERQRREREEQEQQQQQQQQGENQFNPQRERLVHLIADLKMLKQLEEDMQRSTEQMGVLVETRGGDGMSEVELSLVERLANRHNEITNLFLNIKAQMEEAMAAMSGGGGGEDR